MLQPGVIRMTLSKNLFELTEHQLCILMKLINQKKHINKTSKAFSFPNIDQHFRFYQIAWLLFS